jgi:hypothetical protein
MRKIFFYDIVLFFIFITFPCSLYAAISTGQQQKILFISESHGSGGDSSIWKVSDDFLTKKATAAFQVGTGSVSQTTFAGATSALNTVRTAVYPSLGTFVYNLAAYLKDKKYVFARVDWFYNFTDSADDNTAKKVYLPLIIYPDGRVRNLGWRVITSTPRILYYIYKSKNTESNLPANWSYPDGGILYKYVLDQNFVLISSSTVDANGRYDPPLTPEGDSVLNPNSGLELLISEVVKPEIDNKNALFSIIDYARRVQPVEDCNAQGDCVSRVVVESLERKYFGNVGGGCYTTKGRIGYELSYQNERYLVEPSGNYVLTATYTGYMVSPTQSYEKTVPAPAPAFYTIIDPFSTFTTYNFDVDTFNNLPCNNYLFGGSACSHAPVQSDGCVYLYNTSGPFTSCSAGSCPTRIGENYNCYTGDGTPGVNTLISCVYGFQGGDPSAGCYHPLCVDGGIQSDGCCVTWNNDTNSCIGWYVTPEIWSCVPINCTCMTGKLQSGNTCTYNSFASGGNNFYSCVYTAVIAPQSDNTTCAPGNYFFQCN